MQKLRYRWQYWERRLLRAVGVCPTCWQRVNYTTAGRAICPQCGR